MALGLKDLKKNKKTEENAPQEDSKKVLRPWESFDQLTDQTRTLRGNEAYKKSQQRQNSPSPSVDLQSSPPPPPSTLSSKPKLKNPVPLVSQKKSRPAGALSFILYLFSL